MLFQSRAAFCDTTDQSKKPLHSFHYWKDSTIFIWVWSSTKMNDDQISRSLGDRPGIMISRPCCFGEEEYDFQQKNGMKNFLKSSG